jgi:hypothetical protein
MPILLIVHRCCSTVVVALVSSVGERLGVMNAYVIGHDGAVLVIELMELSNCCYCFCYCGGAVMDLSYDV